MLTQMVDLGYESDNAILNLGSVIVFLGLYMLELVFYVFLIIIMKVFSAKCGPLVRLEKWLYDKMFYQEILTLIMEAYLEFVISGVLNVMT